MAKVNTALSTLLHFSNNNCLKTPPGCLVLPPSKWKTQSFGWRLRTDSVLQQIANNDLLGSLTWDNQSACHTVGCVAWQKWNSMLKKKQCMVVRAASKESGKVLEIKAERPDWVGHVEGSTGSRRKTTEEIYRCSERKNNVNCREKRASMDRVGWGHMIGLWSLLKETTTRKRRRKQHIDSSSPNGTFYNIFYIFFFLLPNNGFPNWLLAWCTHRPWVFL